MSFAAALASRRRCTRRLRTSPSPSTAGQSENCWPRRPPPVAQQFEQLRRQHHITIPLPFALFDPERHALTVDVGHLEVRDLGHPQARAVGDAERVLVLEARRGFEETRHLLLAQNDRRLARLVHDPQRVNQVGPFERHGEKEPQRGDGGVDRPGADLLLGHMQLKAAKIVARRGVRRPAEEGRKGPDMPNVVLPGRFAEPRAVMSSIKRCRSGLMGLSGIAKAPVWHGVEPHDLETGSGPRVLLSASDHPAVARHPYRERFSSQAESYLNGAKAMPVQTSSTSARFSTCSSNMTRQGCGGENC
jgi:hypothetical protein